MFKFTKMEKTEYVFSIRGYKYSNPVPSLTHLILDFITIRKEMPMFYWDKIQTPMKDLLNET